MRDWQAFVRARLDVRGLTPGREARVVREIAAQLEDLYRDAIAHGVADADADRQASEHVVDWRRLADEVRRADPRHARPPVDVLIDALERKPGRQGGRLMMAHLVRDARYGFRQLFRAPGFALVAILTIALGVGATTAIFSVVNGVLLRPLPYPQSNDLVRVYEIVPQLGQFSVAPANFIDWRAQNSAFERIAAYSGSSATLIGADGPERIQGAAVSWDLFPLLRVAPALGSSFTDAQDKPGANDVIVISDGMWQKRFGGDHNVVGRAITLSGKAVTVIGVMPAGFYFPNRTVEFWQPIAINPANATRGGHFLGVIARTKPGVTAERAGDEMRTIAMRLATQYPDASAGESAKVVRLIDQMVGSIRPALMTLFAAAALVVLIACANVANLLLARASSRDREIAIRIALGADRKRIAGQMLAESLVLSIVGGAVGIGLAYVGLPPLLTLGAGSIPRSGDVGIDGTVLLFAAALSIVTGILFGLAPAWQSSRAKIGATLKEGGRSSTTGGRLTRNGLLVAEMTLSIVLLTGAALMLRSFDKLINVDPGFKPEHALAFQVSLPGTGYSEPARVLAFYDRLQAALESTPGIESVGFTQTLPMRGDYNLSFNIRGRAPNKPNEDPSADYRAIGPHYFDALGIPILKGRPITADDRATSQHAAVVDQSFARKYFPGEDPIGQGIRIGNGVNEFYEVVGVAGDVRSSGLDTKAGATMYAPITQDTFSSMWVVARTKGDPSSIAAGARQAVRSVDPALPTFTMTPMTTVVNDTTTNRQFSMSLLLVFACLALCLAAVGLYGVVAYSVSQRTREIGLRMALGANPRDVLTMVIGGGMKLALIGVVIGLIGAFGAARLAQTLLFEVPPSDPISYLVTAGLLIAVAALACYVPARRAMRVDPLVALQEQ